MFIKFLVFLQRKIFNPKLKKILEQIGFYNFVKNRYRRLIIFIGKNGLKLKIKDVPVKIIVSNPNELAYYYSLDNERVFLEKFLDKVNNQTIFYDIGAHIGLYSLSAAQYKITPKFIYCWEPEPFNFKRLKENIDLNKIKIIRPFSIALGSENSIFQMASEAKEPGSLTASLAKKVSKSILVQVVRGDDFVLKEKLYLPTIMKIDVEGYEFNILKGFERTLKKSQPIIFLETHPLLLKNLGINQNQVFDFLYNLDYKITSSSSRGNEGHYILEPTF